MQSDVLFDASIRRMARGKNLTLMHLPDTGHAPLLADRNQISFVRDWLDKSERAVGEWTVLHAPPREPYAGSPLNFAPLNALR